MDSYDMIVSPDDLSGIWMLPNDSISGLERLTARWLPVPASLFIDPDHPQALLIGEGRRQDSTWAPVGFPYDMLRFPMWITAPMGRGKSVLLITMLRSLLRAGAGFLFMDCKAGDMIPSVLAQIPLDREGDVIVVTTTGSQATGTDMRVAINLLWPSLRETLRLEADVVASQFIGILATLDSNLMRSPGMMQFAQMSLLALLHGEPRPTVAHLARFFADESYRSEICERLTDPSLMHVRDFWERRFPSLPSSQLSSIPALERRLDRLTTSPLLQPMMIAQGCSIDLRRIMDTGRILLMGVTGGDGEETRVIVSLLLQQLVLAALSRSTIPESERRDWPIFVDEVQIIAQANEQILQVMLSQLRSMRIGQCYVHQGMGQLPKSVLSVLQDNAQNRIIMGSEANDAQAFARLYGAGQRLTPTDFANLEVHPRHGYAMHIYAKTVGTGLWSVRPLPPPPPVDDPPYPPVYLPWQSIRAPARSAADQSYDDLYEQVTAAASLSDKVALLLPLLEHPDPELFAGYCRRTAAHRAAQRQVILDHPGIIPEDPTISDPTQRALERKRRRIQILSDLEAALPREETAALATAIFAQRRTMLDPAPAPRRRSSAKGGTS